MPIRFRCPYCNQLLGIARRKAGTVVNCPTCRSPVTVPQSSQEDAPASPPPAAIPEPEPVPAPAPALFERSDFEEYLHDPVAPAPPPAAPAPVLPPPVPRPAPNPFDIAQLEAPAAPAVAPAAAKAPAGIVLSPVGATILTVAGIILLAVAFGAGLLIGRFL